MNFNNPINVNKKYKYASVPSSGNNIRLEYPKTAKRRLDSDDLYDPNFNIKYDTDEIDYRIKINEVCLFSQYNESEWTAFHSKYQLSKWLVYSIGLLITLLSLANAVWLQFFSKFNIVLSALYLYEKLSNQLVYHSIVFYFVIECLSVVIDLIKLLQIRRTGQLVSHAFSFQNSSLLAHELANERIELEKKLIESVQHLKNRIYFRKLFKSVQTSLLLFDLFINIHFFLFVFVVKYVIAIMILVDLPNTQSIPQPSEKHTILLYENQNFTSEFYQEFGCNYFKQANQTSSSDVDCSGILYENTMFLYIYLSVVLLVTATLKLATQLTQTFLYKKMFVRQLVRMHDTNDRELLHSFENSKRMIVQRNVQNAMDENSRLVAKSILNLIDDNEQEIQQKGIRKKQDSFDEQGSDDDNKDDSNYVNVLVSSQRDNDLSEEEKSAINLIDQAYSDYRNFQN